LFVDSQALNKVAKDQINVFLRKNRDFSKDFAFNPAHTSASQAAILATILGDSTWVNYRSRDHRAKAAAGTRGTSVSLNFGSGALAHRLRCQGPRLKPQLTGSGIVNFGHSLAP
jgi:hypothetical protein